jgi:MazG family protein
MSNLSSRAEQLAAFDRLLTIMDELRAQCPWDKKQTTESLRHLTIEETFELSDAILEGNPEEVKKEVGDLLLHLVFYAKIGSEQGQYDIRSVIDSLCEKLIRRHPHIYGDAVADDEEAVKQNWEKIKLTEKGNTSVLGGVPRSLPALIKAMRIQEKARAVGFEWEKEEQVFEKVEEEFSLVRTINSSELRISVVDSKGNLGIIQGKEKLNHLQTSDIFLTASYSEGFSRALLEAMSVGKPLVFTPVGAHREAISNENGKSFIPGDLEGLYKAIKEMLNNKERKLLGLQNRKLVETKFSIEKITFDFKEIINKVLSR